MISHRVDKLDELLARLQEAGEAVMAGPESYQNVRFAWIMDPDGNRWSFESRCAWMKEQGCAKSSLKLIYSAV